MKYQEWLEEWLENFVKPAGKEKTYTTYSWAVTRYLAPALGGREVAELDPAALQAFVARLAEGGRRLSSNAVNLIITVMQNSLKCACAMGKTPTYTASNVRRPRIAQGKMQCFSALEQVRIEQAILNGRRRDMYGVVVCLYTGLRIGELLALKWEDIDFKSSLLYVCRTGRDSRDGGGRYTLVTNSPKTATSQRCIPIPRNILKMFSLLRSGSLSEFVFSRNARPILIRSYQRSFERLLARLGIPRRGFHALRHTFATRAVECGMDVRTLSEILGHKSPSVTLNRYVHSFMEQKRKMMNKVGEKCFSPDGVLR